MLRTIRHMWKSESGFTLLEMGTVSVIIAALAAIVAVAVTGAAGTHNVQWDSRDSQGRKVPNGVYFYTITTNDFTQTNKMVFIK